MGLQSHPTRAPHPYLVLCDVDEQLLLQKLLQDVLGCHVNQGLEETSTLKCSRGIRPPAPMPTLSQLLLVGSWHPGSGAGFTLVAQKDISHHKLGNPIQVRPGSQHSNKALVSHQER